MPMRTCSGGFQSPSSNLREFLTAELQNEGHGGAVVIKHRVPTFLNYPVKYKDSSVNEAFGVELHDFTGGRKAAARLYGHHHVNTPAVGIGNTRMLTSQPGYVERGEHRLFNRSKTFSL